MAETALYPIVKRFLQARGFEVKGEVNGCDIAAVRSGPPARLVVVEMKLGLNLELVLQAVDRLRVADELWLAVPKTRRGRDRDRRVHRLCRLLGIGLIAVDQGRHWVEVLAQPGSYHPRQDRRRRRRLLAEHSDRKGDPMPGGSTRQPMMTAYRQQALACAMAMRDGPRRPRDLRDWTPRAGRILLRNVYGWFERTEHGVYRLTPLGEAAVCRWADGPQSGDLGTARDFNPE